MEKYLERQGPSSESPKQHLRDRWQRSSVELSATFHELSILLLQSYSEIGSFQHLYHAEGVPCATHGISALDFDNEGIYLVSMTRLGCLIVHDFEALDCHLACASIRSGGLRIVDVSYISSELVEVLGTKRVVSVLRSDVYPGLTDIAFTATDKSRLVACDTHGVIKVWDRRTSVLPCLGLSGNSRSPLNSIQLHEDNQVVFAAGKHGIIGGTTSAAFQIHKELCHPPLASVKLASLPGKIGSLKSNIVPQEIHSVGLDPSCPCQLALHLDEGWPDVSDIYNYLVTHVHCPPPAWLNGSTNSADLLHLRKPSWLPTNSIYVVGSSSENGVHLLDFYPDSSSPSHVDFYEDTQKISTENSCSKHSRFIKLSDSVTASVSLPLSHTIIAGMKNSSLLMVSQKHESTSHLAESL